MEVALLSAFFLYFTALIGIGFYFSRKNNNAASYMLGNRSVNYYVTAIATQASDMGSWLFLGLPAAVYLGGIFEYWTAIGLTLGMFATWTFIAPRLRAASAQLNSLTLTSFFSQAVGDSSGRIDVISGILTIIFFTFYIASGLVGLSILFESAFGIPYQTGMIISLCTVALYTLVGGFVAVAWCDFFQGIFLMCMIVLVPVYAFFTQTSWAEIMHYAAQKNLTMSLFTTPKQILTALSLAAGWGLGYFGQPHILVNFMGIDDPKNIPAARRIGITWQIIVLTAAGAIGVVGIGFFAGQLPDAQLVYINMTQALFHPFIAGLVLCAIFSATLSTLDSLILVSGATIAENILPHITKRSYNMVTLSRISSICVALIALGIAWQNNSSVYSLVNYAWSGLGSSFGPLMIATLYFKHVSKNAALLALITGGAVSALWPYVNATVLPLVPGFAIGLLILGLDQVKSR